MKALILASGIGSRLMPMTENLPKSLIKVGRKTILDVEIENLTRYGITEIIITTGYWHQKLSEYVRSEFPSLQTVLVNNPRFDATNYIYSMWLTREHIDDDIVILHGDMVFEEGLLERLIEHPSENGALINNVIELPRKDFKALVENDRVKQIGVNLFGCNTFFCAPIYKFSQKSFLKWLDEIDLFVQQGKVSCYAEDAFNNISHEIELKAVYYGEEFCMEIDTPGDLDVARQYYKKG